ncbi:HDOD domain-containing protein [Chitiniphilus purpureus]|uniref:HDOD domain-containing protein n=1 Tax=Chitiniphilus purpureus TaxID=2981137 RepID=A0ABY6DN20_9NEIS|nr:HDOD domain-containing protein [Chitiniphilus sp. CD1]UXY14891.1 HDOD domain-containing protein [Chitiniphilus sp. CD1]
MKMEELFDKVHQLPTIPKVVQELIDTFDRDEVDIDAIASKIALDQVITAKVLRLANSSHYGASRKVASVDDAIVVLGFNVLRTLVVASGVTGAFVSPKGFDRQQFWKHSLAVAATAKWLAKPAKVPPEIAFTTGMLHNIGELLIHVVDPELAGRIDQQVATGGNRVRLEETQIGFDYVQVGAELARRWSFPNEIVEAIRHQHDPQQQQPPSALTQVLSLAIYVVDQQEREATPEQFIAGFPDATAAAVGTSAQALLDARETLAQLAAGYDELLR